MLDKCSFCGRLKITVRTLKIKHILNFFSRNALQHKRLFHVQITKVNCNLKVNWKYFQQNFLQFNLCMAYLKLLNYLNIYKESQLKHKIHSIFLKFDYNCKSNELQNFFTENFFPTTYVLSILTFDNPSPSCFI